MNEGALAAANAGGYRASDLDCALGVFLGGEKCLAAGNFDLAFVPRHHGAVAADQPNGERTLWPNDRSRSRRLVPEPLGGPLEDKALGDIVRIILDKGLFDEQGKVVVGELESVALADVIEKPCGDGVGDVRNERAILLVEDILFLAARGEGP